MNEQRKLSEAKYFYAGMCATYETKNEFLFELSAFLSASRSVLLYARKEAQNKIGGQRWFDEYCERDQLLGFFRDRRDLNIHTEPIKVTTGIQISPWDTINIPESVNVVLIKRGAENLYESGLAGLPDKIDHTQIRVKYTFADWPGTEEVLELSRQYYEHLLSFVNDGKQRGFISG